MGTRKSLVFWELFLLASCIKLVDGQDSDRFTCKAGEFVAGQTATITCDFRTDVSDKEPYQYYVAWYPLNQPNSSRGMEVMACFRTQPTNKLACRLKEGYRKIGDIGKEVTLEIPNVKAQHAGRYSCQYVPPDGKTVDTCTLTVQGGDGQTETDKGISPLANLSKETLAAVIILGALLAVFLCIILVLLVLYIRLRRSRFQPHGGTQLEDARKKKTFKKLWKDFPKSVRTALSKKGFDRPESLEMITAAQIKGLDLKEGHVLLLEAKVHQLQKGRSPKAQNESHISIAVETDKGQEPHISIAVETDKGQEPQAGSDTETDKDLGAKEALLPSTLTQ